MIKTQSNENSFDFLVALIHCHMCTLIVSIKIWVNIVDESTLSTVFPWHSNCICWARQHGEATCVFVKTLTNVIKTFKVNMTSTATIVANSPGNFIIEANCPLSLMYWISINIPCSQIPIPYTFQPYTNILCSQHELKCCKTQGGAVLRNSTGDLATVWEEKKELAFSVTNWSCFLQIIQQTSLAEKVFLATAGMAILE